ncbi:MAG: TenA family protein [Candidatus Caldatribacteriaceae bacterium]
MGKGRKTLRFVRECKENVAGDWQKILTHPFLIELSRGVLPRGRFDYYLSQDDYYLEDLLSTLGILVAKSSGAVKDFAIRLLYETLQGEVAMHETIAREGGKRFFPKGEVASVYGDFLLRTAYQGDSLDILVVLCPCFLSYKEIGEQFFPQVARDIPSVYLFWLGSYASESYGKITDELLVHLEEKARGISEARRKRCFALFQRATWLEYRFWQESYEIGLE